MFKRQLRPLFSLSSAIMLLASLGACDFIPEIPGGETPGTEDPPEPSMDEAPELKELRSKLKRDKDPELTQGQRIVMRDGNLDLSFDLLRAAAKDTDKNVAVSAVSLRSAFGMIHAMARGETQNEIRRTMHFLPDPDESLAALNDIDLTLGRRQREKVKGQSAVVLSSANRMFIDSKLRPGSEFLDDLARNFGAGVFVTDFAKDPDGSRNKINQWVSHRTFSKIPEFFPADSITSNTEWTIANTLHFRAPWTRKFDASHNDTFKRLDGTEVPADYVEAIHLEGARDGRGGDFYWVDVPLRGEDLSAMFIVPYEDMFEKVQSTLSAQTINTALTDAESTPINIYLPKFNIDTGPMNLTPMLKERMPSVFEEPDFSGFRLGVNPSKTIPSAAAKVLQSVSFAADEDGVEAATASSADGLPKDGADNPVFTLYRPFFFVIRDRSTGIALFAGRVTDPSR